MTIFGKILLFFNLLAVGGFVYLSTRNYHGEPGKGNGRQAIAAAGVRHVLLVHGLPFDGPEDFDPEDETPFRVEEMPGGVPTETTSKKLVELYLSSAPVSETTGSATAAPLLGGDPIPNQIAEVRRVRAKIAAYFEVDKKIEERTARKPEEKLAALNTWLLVQAETLEERTEILQLLSPTDEVGADKTAERVNKDIDELVRRLLARFDAVINPAEPPDLTKDASPTPAQIKARRQYADDVQKLTELSLEYRKAEADYLAVRQRIQFEGPLEPPDLKTVDSDKARAAFKEAMAKLAKRAAELLDQMAAKKKAADEVKARLPESVVLPTTMVDRRDRVAHLLTHLDTDATWQKRVMMVIGLRRYVGVIAAQADRFKEMARRLEKLILEDHSGWFAQERVLRDFAKAQTQLSIEHLELQKKWAEQAQREGDFVKARKTQLEAIEKLLTKVKEEVDELLARQSAIEQGLFEVQREVAITLDEVYKLEEDLDARERVLLGLPPRPKNP